MSPRASVRSELLRAGFQDSVRAREQLARLGEQGTELRAVIGVSADPDTALDNLVDLVEASGEGGAELLETMAADEGTAMRLLGVLGASQALADHLVRHPDQWRELRDPTLGSTRMPAFAIRERLLRSVGADPHDPVPRGTVPDAEAVDALRVEYRRILLRLAARDLTHEMGLDDVAAELSDLAAGTLDAALALARTRVGAAADDVRLAVIAMGKCGGHELNYVSDVDVIFVHEPVEGSGEDTALRVATQLSAQLMQICSDQTREGTIWPVDANLRPEGRNGVLSRTVNGHRGYYERWAKTWEFQALLKARPVAGDLELGREYVEMVAPLVWDVASREGFVDDVRAMRRRVVDHIPADQAERQLKLGSGGLRDVEFAVQLLQLVHGRSDPSVRSGTTLSALALLARGGYVAREDADRLHRAYSFLRKLEHRIQMHRLRRTHVVPSETEALRRLGRGMGHLKNPVAGLEEEWAAHRREVRRLHEKLFYRPLLVAVAQIPGEQARLSPEAAGERLAALGFADPPGALRHLEALTTGVSRTAAIQRTLLPVMLEWFAGTPDPDAALFGFRKLSEALGATHWYLRLLRDEGQVAEHLATLLGTSRYATDLLQREPEGVRMLAEPLRPLTFEAVEQQMIASAKRHRRPEDAIRAVRGIRRRELLRIAAGDLLGEIDVAEVGAALSRLTDASLSATLEVAGRAVRESQGLDREPTRMAIVAMGRYGGFELSYASDADVMFVHDPLPDADPQKAASYAQAVATELRRLLGLAGPDPALEVDADLRPEGRQGPLVRTLESYRGYYAKWSEVWEFQALLRADAVVGDADLRERFTAMIDPLRFPAEGLSDDAVIEVRRIKSRVDTERLPRGADPHTHLKLGRGGLADIEWTVQLLQMRYAGRFPGLRTPRTLPALEQAAREGLIGADDAAVLADAWRLVSRVRNSVALVRGRPGDQFPSDSLERAALASILGYEPGHAGDMLNDYLRLTRRAHQIVERIFWGE